MTIELVIGILQIILIATTPLVFAGIGELVTEKSGVLKFLKFIGPIILFEFL